MENFDGKMKLIRFLPDNLRNYDVALRRFRVHESDQWKGIAPPPGNFADLNPEPPIFSSKFANFGHNKHILAISNEEGMVRAILFRTDHGAHLLMLLRSFVHNVRLHCKTRM